MLTHTQISTTTLIIVIASLDLRGSDWGDPSAASTKQK
jgi:hypothetical protein